MRLILFTCISFLYLQGASFQAYTENMPPYNYMQGGEVEGFSTHLLQEILQVAGHKLNEKIKIEPWANSYQKVITTPKSIIYSMARSAKREEKFAWVGPIDTMEVGLLAKKSKNITIRSKDDLNRYTIATLPTSMAENELLKQGVYIEKLDRFSLISSQLKKLRDDRVDAVAFSIPGMFYIMDDLNMDPKEYEMVYLLKEVDLYFGFHKYTKPALIKELNAILQDIRSLHRLSATYQQ